MSRAFRAAWTAAALALAAAATLTARPDGRPQASGEGMPDGPGKDATVRTCGGCHEARRAASVRLTRDGWANVIESMVRRGAKVGEGEFDVVLEYLSTHFLGEAAQPVNVNTAPRIDLESVAGLLRSEAAAIVSYREKHGRFTSLDDLKKVPGLDFSKIESRRDFLIAL